MVRAIELERVTGTYAVCRLEPDAPVPAWAEGASFSSITRTDNELSIVCPAARVPPDVRADRGWACLFVREADLDRLPPAWHT
jgi:uncharacterized protein